MTLPKSFEEHFDFEQHKLKAKQVYQQKRQIYINFSEAMKKILEQALFKSKIKVASIEARAKGVKSFEKKHPSHHQLILKNQNIQILFKISQI